MRIEIGSLDLGQHVALLHVGAVVKMPVLQVAVDPGVDRRLVPRLHSAGERHPLHRGAGMRRDDGDRGDRQLLRPFPDLGVLAARVLTGRDALRQARGNHLVFIQLASIRPWLRVNESTPWIGARQPSSGPAIANTRVGSSKAALVP